MRSEDESDSVWLTADELEAWRAELEGVKPLAAPVAPPQKPLQKTDSEPARRLQAALKKPSPATRLHTGKFHQIDKATARRIKRGQYEMDATIDLHGYTKEAAFQILQQCIIQSVLEQKRMLKVITGKGRGGDGVLRQSLPDWLNDESIRPYVLAFDTARPQDGGSGAFYVLLKKLRVVDE